MHPTRIRVSNMKRAIIKSMLMAVLISVFSLGTSAFCNAQSRDENDEMLELMISETNKTLPAEYSTGMVNTKLVREGNYVVYYYVCDEDIYDIDLMKKNLPDYKGEVLAELNSDDLYISLFREVCKDAGVGVGYVYIGKDSGKKASIYIPVSQLK